MAIDPTGADLKRFVEHDTGPVVMLNLPHSQPGGGRARYQQRSEALEEAVLQPSSPW